MSEAYDRSYAHWRALAIQADAVRAGEHVVIIDDVVASGETALAGITLIQRAGGRCVGVGCLAGFPNWGMRRIRDQGIAVRSIAHL